MAMMMTGRVLLVCALCVLWCGVCTVAAADTGGVEMERAEGSESLPSGPSDGDGGKQESEGSVRQVSDTANESLVAVDGKNSKQQDGVVITTPTKPERTSGGTETEEIKRKEQKENPEIPNKDDKTTQLTSRPKEEEEPSAERGKAQGAALPGASPGVPSRAQNGNSAEDLTATPGEERALLEDHSDQPQGGKTPADGLAAEMPSREKGEARDAIPSPPAKNEKTEGGLRATTNTEKNNLENAASVQKTEILLDDEEATSNQRNEGLASTTGNQEGEPSDVHAELTPPTISAASNAANEDADTDTDKGILNNDLAAGGGATEGAQQDEKKERAEETTPLKSVAMINETATVGDSDSSTAVSHTTSPLLLLLVVACAAAAAVVAA